MLCSVLAAGLLISTHFERREAPAPRGTPTLGCLGVFAPSVPIRALCWKGKELAVPPGLSCCDPRCLHSLPSTFSNSSMRSHGKASSFPPLPSSVIWVMCSVLLLLPSPFPCLCPWHNPCVSLLEPGCSWRGSSKPGRAWLPPASLAPATAGGYWVSFCLSLPPNPGEIIGKERCESVPGTGEENIKGRSSALHSQLPGW